MKKRKLTQVRFMPEVKSRLEDIIKRSGITMSALVNVIVFEYLERHKEESN